MALCFQTIDFLSFIFYFFPQVSLTLQSSVHLNIHKRIFPFWTVAG